MRAENIIWISEPSQPYDEKNKRWPKWTYWKFKTKEYDLLYIMNEEDHEVYLAEKELLEFFEKSLYNGFFHVRSEIPKLIKLIEKYGDLREEKGRSDVNEAWAEERSGASL